MHARRFEELMRIVARAFHVLPLREAVDRLANGDLPPRAMTITFDDGYADNHDLALPILRRLQLPATVFVSTAFLNGGRMWNDTVIECLRRSRSERIDLEDWGLPAMRCVTAAERRQIIDRLLPLLKYRLPKQREPMLQRLQALCGHPELPTDLMMTSAQVCALPRSGIDIGAHTVNHPILKTLPDDVARDEISDGRAQLQQLLDDSVDLFAYPNGCPGRDYDQRHVDMVRDLGFRAAMSTQAGVAKLGDDPFNLPRFTPWQMKPLSWIASLARHHASV
jgi:peptidoglycan/xylan/chitin deacetylase (PgdA/CDA1 family)